MSYNKKNYNKRCEFIIDVYSSVKEYDIPDTFIVAKLFPKSGIIISYRSWMDIKSKFLTKKNKK